MAHITDKNEHITEKNSLSDLDGLRVQSEEGARMGFTGKQVIHPTQVKVVQEAFSPTAERIAWASQLIEAFNTHQGSGKVSHILLQYNSKLHGFKSDNSKYSYLAKRARWFFSDVTCQST